MAQLAHLYVLKGDLKEAQLVQNSLSDLDPDETASAWAAPIFLVDAEISLAQDKYEDVISRMDETITILGNIEVHIARPDARYLKGQALLNLGQTDKAYEVLAKARAEAEAIGTRTTLWPILVALSQLESDPAEVAQLHQQAQEIVEFIANNTGSSELRASFLDLPEVQVVLKFKTTQ